MPIKTYNRTMTLKMNFIGKNTEYLTADGKRLARLHLDGAASPLASTTALETVHALLPHYSNSHSYVHSSAQISTQALEWAHNTLLNCVHAKHNDYTAIFTGSGTTSACNRLARGLAKTRNKKTIVLISAMEHHANDLPHRQHNNHVIYIPLKPSSHDQSGAHAGCVDLDAFEKLCQTHSNQINYIAVSSVSNVTGINNPIKKMTEIAHQHGALMIVDAAQSVAHQASFVSDDNIDFMVFSGHKVYTPMSPGVLIAKRTLLKALPEQDLGGGSVSSVSAYDYELTNTFPDREQSGTPNIIGAVALAKVMHELHQYGFEKIQTHSNTLTKKLITGLNKIPQITVYGDLNLTRTGAIAFNHKQIDHGLFAAILNDYYAIAVRNECFCAHPYVSQLLKEQLWELDLDDIEEDEHETYINLKRGMIRASVSLYTTFEDIEHFLRSVIEISQNIDKYRPHYRSQPDGSYHHKSFSLDWKNEVSF